MSWLLSQQEDQGPGEPEWMPSQEDVARARADLKRRGVTRRLAEGAAAPSPAHPGQPPWGWLAGGALWLLAWPAVLALRFGAERFTWLPWWAPVLLAAAHMGALALWVVRWERAAGPDVQRTKFAAIRTPAQMVALEPAEFESWIGLLFRLNGFQVRDTPHVADHGIDLVVTGPGARVGLVQCKRYRGTVGEPVVRDLYGVMMHEHADMAWLATTGGISRKARDWANGKPVELWDGKRLMELAERAR